MEKLGMYKEVILKDRNNNILTSSVLIIKYLIKNEIID